MGGSGGFSGVRLRRQEGVDDFQQAGQKNKGCHQDTCHPCGHEYSQAGDPAVAGEHKGGEPDHRGQGAEQDGSAGARADYLSPFLFAISMKDMQAVVDAHPDE